MSIKRVRTSQILHHRSCECEARRVCVRHTLEWQHVLSRVKQTCLSLLLRVWSPDTCKSASVQVPAVHMTTQQSHPILDLTRALCIRWRDGAWVTLACVCLRVCVSGRQTGSSAACECFSQIRCGACVPHQRERRLCEGRPLPLCDMGEWNERLHERWSLRQSLSPNCQSLHTRTRPHTRLIQQKKSSCLETPGGCERGYRQKARFCSSNEWDCVEGRRRWASLKNYTNIHY